MGKLTKREILLLLNGLSSCVYILNAQTDGQIPTSEYLDCYEAACALFSKEYSGGLHITFAELNDLFTKLMNEAVAFGMSAEDVDLLNLPPTEVQ